MSKVKLFSPPAQVWMDCDENGGYVLKSDFDAQRLRIAELEGREVLAEAEGILTFMRSDSDGCGCCEGHHVFCRYFEGVKSFDDFSQNTRFRNDLEGRRFRISIELIPDIALNPEAESHE